MGKVMKKNGSMKKCLNGGILGFGILGVALAGLQDPASAEIMRGTVIAVKDDDRSFTFKRADPSNPSITEPFEIVVLPDTKFEKIGSLNELAPGDEVAVDLVQKKESKIWEAHSVRIFKMRLYQTDAAQKAQPD